MRHRLYGGVRGSLCKVALYSICGDISIKTGKISKLTQGYGLSLGDRACLATAIQLGLPVYTADKIWAELDLPNVKINLIR